MNDNSSIAGTTKSFRVKAATKVRSSFNEVRDNFRSKKNRDSQFTNTLGSISGASTTPPKYIHNSGTTISTNNPNDDTVYLEGRVQRNSHDTRNNIDFLPTFERMFDTIVPLLTQPPQQSETPKTMPKLSKNSRICTAGYESGESNWVALFFQRLDNWIQLALLPVFYGHEAILVDPPIVEVEDGTPLACHLDEKTDTLRLFYCQKDETCNRVLSEKILRLKLNKNSTWEEGSLHELKIRLSDDSNITFNDSPKAWEYLTLFIITPSFSLQMVRNTERGWKTFTSTPLEKTSIRIKSVYYEEWPGFLWPFINSKLTLIARHGATVNEYIWYPWGEKNFHAGVYKKKGYENLVYRVERNWYYSMLKSVHYTSYSVFESYEPPDVVLDRYAQKGIREVVNLGRKHKVGIFVWLDAHGQLRRSDRRSIQVFEKYRNLALSGSIVFSDQPFTTTLEKVLEPGDYSLCPPLLPRVRFDGHLYSQYSDWDQDEGGHEVEDGEKLGIQKSEQPI